IDRGGYGRNSGFVGSTSLDLGVTRVCSSDLARPVLRRRPLVSSQTARFVQTIGGRTGMPFPRLTGRPPFLAWNSSTAWTTLVLTLHADGRKDGWLLGASPFPRHFLYDEEGNLMGDSAVTNFARWFSTDYGRETPSGGSDIEQFEHLDVVARRRHVGIGSYDERRHLETADLLREVIVLRHRFAHLVQ